MDAKQEYYVGDMDGLQRLDKASAGLCPELGLRARRRLCEEGGILVNGHKSNPAYKVRLGDLLTLAREEPEAPNATAVLIKKDSDLAAVCKPAHLHSVSLSGKRDANLENLLSSLTGQAEAALLNRLDYGTSGLLAVALNQAGKARWRLAQTEGRLTKLYLALLEGELSGPRIVRQELDTQNRSRTRVLQSENPDPARHTSFTPLAVFETKDWPGPISLTLCEIKQGARHQIRAHAAWLGLPILGDELYGAEIRDSYGFFLHHAKFSLPGFTASCPPNWLERLPEQARQSCAQILADF